MMDGNNIEDEGASANMNSQFPLPTELLAEIIFKYVPLHLWSSCLELVSHQFQDCVILAYSRLKTVNIRHLLPFEIGYSRQYPLGCLQNVPFETPINCLTYTKKSRCQPKSHFWLTQILEKLLKVCPTLTELVGFDRASKTFEAVHFRRLKKFDKLQSVTFYDLAVAVLPIVKFCAWSEKLNSLYMERCSAGFDGKGEIMVKAMTNITLHSNKLSLSFQNFAENLTTLKLLNPNRLFRACHEDDSKVMENCRNLNSFTTNLSKPNDYQVFFKILNNLHQLTSLSLDAAYKPPASFVQNLCISLEPMKDRLQSFELHNRHSDKKLEMLQNLLFTKFTRLVNLKLFPILFLSSLNDLHRLSGRLEKFSVSHRCTQQMPPILSSSLIQLSNLTKLHVQCFNETSQNVNMWENIYHLEKLRNLTLPGKCVNDALLKFWDLNGNNMFERLVSLELHNCDNVSDLGACLVAKKAVNLEILSLFSARISDATIYILADIAKKLRFGVFYQSEPLLIDEVALLQLIEKCCSLKKLMIPRTLVNKLFHNNAFLPFVDVVTLVDHYD